MAELIFVTHVAPYVDGPAGVHGVLGQAAVEDGRARAFTTALGHFPAAWESPAYLRHLHGGLTWALATTEDAE